MGEKLHTMKRNTKYILIVRQDVGCLSKGEYCEN